MEQKVSISASANPSDFKAIMYEVSAPNTPVAEEVLTAPHATSQQIVFNGLNPVAHIFRLFEWDGVYLGVMLIEQFLQPTKAAIQTPEDLTLTVGTGADIEPNADFFDGSANPLYADFLGKVAGVDYRIVQRMFGPLRPDEFTDRPPFGFNLLSGTFNDGDTIFIQWIPELIEVPGGSGGASARYKDVIEVTSDTAMDNSYLDSVIDINASSNRIRIDLDFLSNIPDRSVFRFIQNKGNQINAVIQAQAGQSIERRGALSNRIVLTKNDYCELIKEGSVFKLIAGAKGIERVGLVFAGYAQTPETVICQGQVVNRNAYPAIWDFVNTLTLGNGVVTDADWLSSPTIFRGMFSTGDGVDTFRFPDLRGVYMRFLDQGRAIDLIRNAQSIQNRIAGYQADAIGPHSHNITIHGTKRGAGSDPDDGAASKSQTSGFGTTGTWATQNGQQSETNVRNIALLPLMYV